MGRFEGEDVRDDRHDEPLTNEELDLFVQYLHRFAPHDVDLLALMEVGDPEFPCYVTVSRTPCPEPTPPPTAVRSDPRTHSSFEEASPFPASREPWKCIRAQKAPLASTAASSTPQSIH